MARQRLGAEFGKVFTANLSSSLADGIARTAVPLLAVQLTTDPLLISGIAALQMVPWLLFAIPAGLIVDGVDRRLALAISNALRTALAALLFVLALTGTLSIWSLYLVIFLYGIGETIYDGAIRAVVPSLVPKALLPRANGRIEAAENVVQNFLAGPITSLLFVATVLIPLGVNALAFGLAAVLALFLPQVASGRQFAAASTEPRVPWYRQLGDGYRFIFGNRMLTTLLLLSTFIGFMFSAGTATFVLFLIDDQGLPEEWFGVFALSAAAGGVLGSLLASPLVARFRAGPTMAVSSIVTSLGLVPLFFFPNLWVAGAMWFVTSAAVLVWNVLVMSLRQAIIPGRLLGRVHGSWRTILWGSMPFGSLVGGLLARVDITLPFLVGGGLAALAGIVFVRFLWRLPNPEELDNGDPPTPAPAAPTDAGPTDPHVQD